MPHICVSESDQHWLRWWLVAYTHIHIYRNGQHDKKSQIPKCTCPISQNTPFRTRMLFCSERCIAGYETSTLLTNSLYSHKHRVMVGAADRFHVTMVDTVLANIPLPWASVHWLVQCTLECHWLTQCTLRYHWATQRILAGYTGTQLEKLSWNSSTLECHWRNLVETAPHWDATGETLTFAAYIGTPLEGLW